MRTVVRCGSQGAPCTLTFLCLFFLFSLQLKLFIVVHAVVQYSCLLILLRVLHEEVLALSQVSVSVVVCGLASGYSVLGLWFQSGDPKHTQPDWDAAVGQFSLLFFLQLLSDKRGAEISQNLHQIVELISRIESLLQSWSNTQLQVTCVCVGIFQLLVVC